MNIAVIGSSGTLGKALIQTLAEEYPLAQIHAFSRDGFASKLDQVKVFKIEPLQMESLEQAAAWSTRHENLDLVIVATGILHAEGYFPEKSLRDLEADKLQHILSVNTVVPALIARAFLPRLKRNQRTVFAALSARIGSISDNRRGGWYAYRASKAALNMILKTAAIETRRTHPQAIVVGLHPGTVDSPLSRPFQRGVPPEKLFSPQYSAARLVSVIQNLNLESSGRIFAWDGAEIDP